MNRPLSLGLFSAAIVCFLVWGAHYSSLDLWGDEIISLKDFALAGWPATVTTYPDPNNHILFNLVDGVAANVLGVRDLYQAMGHAPSFRWLQWLLALGTCFYVFLVGRRFFPPLTGGLSLVYLVTCLPFLNFSMQLRGYGLSMLFAAALLYHVWAYQDGRSRRHLVLVAVTTFGLLYTVPSNAYFALASGFLIGWRTLWPAAAPDQGLPFRRRSGSMIVGALTLGAFLALLAYSPVVHEVLHNRFTEASPDNRMFILVRRLPQVTLNLLSYRYLLVPICLAGFYFAFRRGGDHLAGSEKAAVLAWLFALPFLFSFLRDDEPFQRTFIVLVPVFSLVLGAGTAWCLESRVAGGWIKDVLALVLALYAFGSLGLAHVTVQARLESALRAGVKEQNILANYYQGSGFRPSRLAEQVARVHKERPGPILLVDDLDPVSLGYYLLEWDLSSTATLNVERSGPEASRTYVVLFQQTQGREQDVRFLRGQIRLNGELRESDRVTPSLLVAHSVEPSDVYYLVTAFSEKNQEFLRALQPVFQFESVAEEGAFTCWRISVVETGPSPD